MSLDIFTSVLLRAVTLENCIKYNNVCIPMYFLSLLQAYLFIFLFTLFMVYFRLLPVGHSVLCQIR